MESPEYHIVRFRGRELKAAPGQNLRHLLSLNGLSPHNGKSRLLNCCGMGSCGTCAVQIIGSSPSEWNGMEKWRLGFPPHTKQPEFRLACQVEVNRNMDIVKHNGFWGQLINAANP